mgnify:CR=1 FL=1
MLLDIEPEVQSVLGALALEEEVVAVEIHRRASTCARKERGVRASARRSVARFGRAILDLCRLSSPTCTLSEPRPDPERAPRAPARPNKLS